MTDLLEETASLVAIPSVSGGEAALADHVAARLASAPGLEVHRVADNVVARTVLGRDRRLLIAGHLDTVPPAANAHPRREGDTLWGLGATDMKGGLAVMLALATGLADPAVDVTLVFYSGEEVAREHNGLLHIAGVRPDLLAADAAVLGEPTSARIEAGCQGVLKLQVTMGGRRAHTARPWTGRNAVHRLAPVLAALDAYQGRQPVISGCRFRESLQAVKVTGGVASNVVPDEVVVHINHRFAPDRDSYAAEAEVRTLLQPLLDPGAGDRLEVVDAAPAAPPGLDHPLLSALLAATGAPARAKLGWTDVAFFAERGVPAVNFGPGDPEVAHAPDERVGADALEAVYAALAALVARGG